MMVEKLYAWLKVVLLVVVIVSAIDLFIFDLNGKPSFFDNPRYQFKSEGLLFNPKTGEVWNYDTSNGRWNLMADPPDGILKE